jgi:coenzyme F420-reducing hydrogenase alpha subunit
MVTNPFRSIVVRAVEVVHAAATMIDLLDRYVPPDPPHAEASPHAAVGHGASEAPRGLLYHRYQIDEEGLIRDAVIVPPTSQNQLRIEEDLRTLLPGLLHQEDSQITHRLEQAIRNYDPCISCATHFLDMRLERR